MAYRAVMLFAAGLAIGPRAAHAQCDAADRNVTVIVRAVDGSTPPSDSGVNVFAHVDNPRAFAQGAWGSIDLSLPGGNVSYMITAYASKYKTHEEGPVTCQVDATTGCSKCDPKTIDQKMYAIEGALEGKVVDYLGRPSSVKFGLTSGYLGAEYPADSSGRYSVRAAGPNDWGISVDSDAWDGRSNTERDVYVKPNWDWQDLEIKAVSIKNSQMSRQDFTQEPPVLFGRCPWSPKPSAMLPDPNVGEPVNVLTGNVWFDQTDGTLRGAGSGLDLTRSYNTQTAVVPGGFGRNWTFALEKSVQQIDATALKVHRGDGMVIYYTDPDGDGVYRATVPATEPTTVTRTPAGGFRVSFPDGGHEEYDAAGRLMSLVTKAGVATVLQRNGAGRLESVTVAGGRSWRFEYDPTNGRIAAVLGPEGALATYAYNGDLLSAVSYPDGSGYSFVYDSDGQILTVTDATGRVIETHAYSGNRAITTEASGGQELISIEYDVAGSVLGLPPGNYTRTTDALGNVTIYAWTRIGGVRLVTKQIGSCSLCGGGSGEGTQEWGYDYVGRVTSYRDATGNLTAYQYDEVTGELLSEIYTPTTGYDKTNGTLVAEAGTARRIDYTYQDGELKTRTAPGEGTVTMTYDPSTRRRTTTQPVLAGVTSTTVVEEDAFGRPRLLIDGRAKTTTLAYTALGDLESVTDPLDHTTRFGYDSQGRRTTVTDALSHVTTTEYSVTGRPTRITQHDQTYTKFTYDEAGRRETVTDPLKRTTRYAYDAYGRVQTVTDPLNGVTRYDYDAMSQLVALTDARGQVTRFEYQRGKVSKVTYPGGRFETFTYYPDGRLWKRIDRKNVTTFDYFPDGTLSEKSYSDGTPSVSYTYEFGRLKTAQNAADTLSWTYDLAGQVRTEASTRNASTVTYNYDLGGNRTALDFNGVPFVVYEYDDASRLDLVRRGAAVFDLGYDNADRRTSLAYQNGVVTDYGYDTLNRLLTLSAKKGVAVRTDLTYTYDDAGNRTSKTASGTSEQYVYDALSRLSEVSRPDQKSLYGYDAAGNRVGEQVNGQSLSGIFNDRNELERRIPGGTALFRGTLNEPGSVTVGGKPARMLAGNVFEQETQVAAAEATVPVTATDETQNTSAQQYRVTTGGSTTDFTYDFNGNTLTKAEGGTSWVYEWTSENQLKRVLKNGVEVVRYSYDPLGRRVERVASGITTGWTYDGDDILKQAQSGAVMMLVHGPGIDEPWATEINGVLSSYYHADGLGSVVALTDGAGAVTVTYRYDAYGKLEQGAPMLYAYTGREWDVAAELYYYRARYYDPKVGRFISEDPIGLDGGDENFYAYVWNSPTNFVDPEGLIGLRPGGLVDPDMAKAGAMGGLSWGAGFLNMLLPGDPVPAPTCGGCEISSGIGGFNGATFTFVGVPAAAGAAKGVSVTFNYYPKARGVGMNVIRNGTRKYGLDWHRFKCKSGEMVNRLHAHWGKTKSQMKKHRNPFTGEPW